MVNSSIPSVNITEVDLSFLTSEIDCFIHLTRGVFFKNKDTMQAFEMNASQQRGESFKMDIIDHHGKMIRVFVLMGNCTFGNTLEMAQKYPKSFVDYPEYLI